MEPSWSIDDRTCKFKIESIMKRYHINERTIHTKHGNYLGINSVNNYYKKEEEFK